MTLEELEYMKAHGAWYERGNPDDVGYYPGEKEEEERLERFRQAQDRIEFENSHQFREDQKIWREAHKSKEHEVVGFNRVWCPVYDKIRPEWLCAFEHGDYHEIMDTEE